MLATPPTQPLTESAEMDTTGEKEDEMPLRSAANGDRDQPKNAPVFCLTPNQFRKILDFVAEHDSDIEAAGICKIVPSRATSHSFVLPGETEIRLHESFVDREETTDTASEKKTVVREFRRRAENARQHTSDVIACAEAVYWREMASPRRQKFHLPYGTVHPDHVKRLLPQLPTDLQSWVRSKASLLRHQTVDIAGVTFPDLRIASFGCGISWTTAPFCMQLLDLSLSSAPIIWYSIPPSEQATFEQFTMQQASKHVYHHPQPLHRSSDPNATDSRSLFKQFVISPKDLVEAGISVYRAVQREGEIIATALKGYYCWMTTGICTNASISLAHQRWLPIGSLSARSSMPFEEILVKEALSVGNRLKRTKQEPTSSQVIVIQEYHLQIDRIRRQQRELQRKGCKMTTVDWPYGSNPCSICHTPVFFSMALLAHQPHPCCLECALSQSPGHLKGSCIICRPKQSLFEALATTLWRYRLKRKDPPTVVSDLLLPFDLRQENVQSL